MKKLFLFLILINLLFGFEIKEFVTCKNVKNRLPINITNKFSVNDKKVYAFAYFKNIEKNTLIHFVWEKNVNGIWKLYADIELPIYQGIRWRTYSNITIRKFFKGKWRVSLMHNDNILDTKEFEILDLNKTN